MDPSQTPPHPKRKFDPPRPEDYRVPAPVSPRSPAGRESAPELGGLAAIMAEFDAAQRSDQFSQALQRLLRCRHNVVPELHSRLEGDDIPVAKKAAIALGYLRSPQSIALLYRTAQRPERHIHWQAAAALCCIGNREAIGLLVKLLGHPSLQVQAAAAKALGRADLAAVSPLIDVLKHADDLVKVHAAHSLGQIGSPLAVPALMQTLGSLSKPVRFEAAWALGQIRSPLAASALAACLCDPDISIQSQAAQALKNIGTPAMPALVQMLQSDVSHTRSVAARTLGQMGLEDAVGMLAHVMYNDPYSFVRCDAALALGEIGTHEAVYHLSAVLRDSDRAVRNAVVRALRRANTPEALAALDSLNRTVGIPNYSVTPAGNGDDAADYTILQSS